MPLVASPYAPWVFDYLEPPAHGIRLDGIRVYVRRVATSDVDENGGPLEGVSFNPSRVVTAIGQAGGQSLPILSDVNGRWAARFDPNESVSPENTYYFDTLKPSGRPTVFGGWVVPVPAPRLVLAGTGQVSLATSTLTMTTSTSSYEAATPDAPRWVYVGPASGGGQFIGYTGTAGNTFTGCFGGTGTIAAGSPVEQSFWRPFLLTDPPANLPTLLSQLLELEVAGLQFTIDTTTVRRVPPATGIRATDEANIQAALDALPPAGGWVILSPGGTYVAERLHVAGKEFVGFDGSGSTVRLPDDDGMGDGVTNIGQIFALSDVIVWFLRDVTFDGNSGDSKAGIAGFPLVSWKTTSATRGRKDFIVEGRNVTFTGTAGFGHLKLQIDENSTSNFSEFAFIRLDNVRSEIAGDAGVGVQIRGPATLVHISNFYAQNDGEFGVIARGIPLGGSTGKAISVSAEVGYNHFIQRAKFENIHLYRTIGWYAQMVKYCTIEGCICDESASNPYYDTAPVAATADSSTDMITSPVPTGYGTASVVKVVSTGIAPGGLTSGNLYFVRDVVGSTFKLATTNGGSAIDLTSNGTGSLTVQWMGYTYNTVVKVDDAVSSSDAPSIIVMRGVKVRHSSLHTSCRGLAIEESVVNTVGLTHLEDCEFDRPVAITASKTGEDPIVRDCTFVRGPTNVNYGTGTPLHVNGGEVVGCYFESQPTISPRRDLMMRRNRFAAALAHSVPGTAVSLVFRLLENVWNEANVGDTILEVSPPPTGITLRIISRDNTVTPGTVWQTKLRVKQVGDLAGLEMLSENDAFALDTGGISDAGSSAFRLTSRNSRNSPRAASAYPLLVLANVAAPDITGGSVFLTGGSTPITNFANGVDYSFITVYVAAGHQINHTASISLRRGTSVAGPAVVQLFRFGGVWRDLAASPAIGTQPADSLPAVSGQYLSLGGGATTLLLTDGDLILLPFWVPGNVDRLAVSVSTAGSAGASLRLLAYADNAYAPAALLHDSGALDTTTTGDKTSDIGVPLPGATWMWFGLVGQGAPVTQATVRASTGIGAAYLVGAVPSTNNAPSRRKSAVSGAPPDPYNGVLATTGNLPRVVARLA